MSEVVTIAYDAVNAILHKPSVAAKLEVQSALSYMVDGAENALAFKQKKWDGRNSFFIYAKSSFPAGFVHLVTERLRQKGYQVKLARRPLPEPLGPRRPVVDSFGYEERYDYQPEVVDRLVKHGQIIAQVATGGGKCLGKDTPVLMYDGSIKMVQDVVKGDLLMGPDSTPRTVLSTCVGHSPLYRVTPVKGDAYVVNDAHILSLKKTSRGYQGKNRDGEKYPKGEIVNINVEDYIKQHNTFKHTHKGWRTGVDFKTAAPLSVDPYLLGTILGDGSIKGSVNVTTMDAETVAMLNEQAKVWGLTCNVITKKDNRASTIYLTSGRTGGKPNPLLSALRELGFDDSEKSTAKKFIPHAYKTASRADRLELLAGILDTDGHYDGKCMYLTLKEEALFDDTLFLVRSLGFAAYKANRKKTCRNNGVTGDYFAMTISGDLDQIPVRLERRKAPPRLQKKSHLVTGISVEAIGEGDYYGFELDGDHLFMLGDFTVTHNTRIARMAYARINRPTLFLTTRSILMYQMKDAFEELGVNCSVLGGGEFGEVNEKGNLSVRKMCVGMVQTLAQRLEETTVENEFQLLYNALTRKQEKEITALKKQLLDAGISGPEIKTRLSRMIDAQQKELEDKAPSMMQKAERKFKEKSLQRAQTIAVLERFEFVILEEAHEASGNSYYEIMRHCKNAHYRLALTGTPFMRESQESNMRLMACSGPIAIKISEEMLIERGILAKPYFKTVELSKNPPKLHIATAWQAAYRLGIVENEERNVKIVNEVLMAMRYGLSTMVLVQHTSHGEKLMKILEMAGVRALYIQGENDQVERKAALKALANGEIDVLIGTTILDVGVDVPAVGLIILAGGGKAEVALRQRIGRGLRAKKLGPNVAFVVDFNDPFNRILREHAAQRLEIIKQTKGFNEGITPEFEYEKLGFKKVA